MSYAQSLVPQIQAILASSDLSQISAKAVRKALVARGQDEATVKQHRKDIDERIEAIYDQLTSGGGGDAGRQDYGHHNDARSMASPSPSYPHPQSSQPEPLNTKPRVKQEIKEEFKPVIPPHASSSSSRVVPVQREETDMEMAARLQREFDAENAGTGRASRAAAAPKKKKKAVKRKSRATVGSDEEEEGDVKKKRKGGGGGAFNKELILSDALSALVGEARLSRPQAVKKIWEYIKANNLQDESDKRYILCDGPLRAVFHTDRLHMFTMNKILVDHVRDPDDIAHSAEQKPSIAKKEEKPSIPQLSSATTAPPARRDYSDSESEDDDDDEY